jgi:hypothetical protein
MKILRPWSFVIPIDLKTPYSHTLSLMFEVVATNKRKKVKIKLITPMMPTMNVNTTLIVYNDSIKAYTSMMSG